MTKHTAIRVMLATGAALMALPSATIAQGTGGSGTLETIVVTGQRQAYRGDVPITETPQSVQILDAKVMNDLNITRLDSALELASGVAKQNNFGGLWDSFAVRGFAGDENFPSGFLVNGFNGGRGYGGPRDASNIDRIEVIKGPNGAVFGRGEPGGTVNIITKKAATEDTFGSVSAMLASYDTYRIEGDANVAVSPNFAVRLNGAYQEGDSFRDTIHTEKLVLSPSALVKIGDSTSLSYEMEFVDQKVPFDRGVLEINGKLGLIPRSRFLGEPGNGPIEVEVLGHQLQLQQDLGGEDWVAIMGFGYRDTSFTGFSADPELVLGRQTIDNDFTNLARQRRFRDYNTTNTALRGEVSGRLNTGNLVHHILVGADWDRFNIDLFQLRYRPPVYVAGSPITAANNAINVFNPVYGQLPVPTGVVQNLKEIQKAYGVYFQDQIDLTDKFKVRVGGRYDHFNQNITNRAAGNAVTRVTKERFSPTAGILYQATDAVGVYAGYGTGFRPNSGVSFSGNPFAPETSKSYEVGLRYTSPDGGIVGTVAAYTMQKTNILTADPVNGGFSIAGGKARSRGFEADITARLPGDMTILATYSFTDAEWRSASLDPNFAQLITVGAPLINIPKHQANILLTKGFEIEGAGKFTIGGGFNHVSKRLGETATNFYLPSYTLARALVNYQPNDWLRVSVDVTNLFNETYYASSYARLWVQPGTPRTVTGRVTASF